MTDPLLTIRNLNVTYHGLFGNVHAVKNFNAEIRRGEAVAIVGESGSGKSTIALALLGLLSKRFADVHGNVAYDSDEVLQYSTAQWQGLRGGKIGMIFQDPMTSLNPYLSIGKQVAEPILRHLDLGRNGARRKVTQLLTEMEVEGPELAFKRFPHQYSGGMRQRVMIASASAADPQILIADEPTTALDVITQARVLRLMRNHLRERDMSLILITHDLGIVAGICDRVLVMKDGELVEHGDANTVYSSPKHPYTKALLAAVPRVDSEQADVFRPTESKHVQTDETLIAIDKVSVHFTRKRFRKEDQVTKAVDNVSLQLKRGEVLGLVGQSGSGKSTLIRAVAGLQPLTAGIIRYGEVEVDHGNRRSLRALRRDVQMIFQDPLASLNPRFTAERIIAEPLINFGIMNRRSATARARELMETVNLDAAWGNRYPHEFSGGQCQRIGIARALAVDPKVLLCDEPVSALDVSIQAEALQLLMRLREELDLTLLFISHDLAVVRHLADRVAVMHRGEIVELQPANEIYHNAQHDYTKSLLAAVPIPDPSSNWLG